jgi:hypothetical protein
LISQEVDVSALIDSTLEEIDSNLRDLRRQLSTLEAFRRQIVGDDRPLITGGDRHPERSAAAIT